MNISEDPSLTGCLIFYLKLGENSIGHNTNNDIIIESLGIRKYIFNFKASLYNQ
jgi:hypothetical protein